MQKTKIEKFIKFIIVTFLLLWFGFFLVRKIDLATADLGRHLKNGELLVNNLGNKDVWRRVLLTNEYSYTNQDHYFVNHHWLTGIVFYLVWKIASFSGLSIFYILARMFGFFLFFEIARRNSNFFVASILAALMAPLMAQRPEIRPELFTYVFAPIVFWLVWKYSKGEISYKKLFWIPVIQIFWVNLNMYFVFSAYLLFLLTAEPVIHYLLEKVRYGSSKPFEERKFKELGVITGLTILTSFCNPWGIQGAIYPFTVHNDIGISISELQPIEVLAKAGFNNPNIVLFKVIMALLFGSYLLRLFLKRENFPFAFFLWGLSWIFLGYLLDRNSAYFAIFALPLVAENVWVLTNGLRNTNLGSKSLAWLGVYFFVLAVAFNLSNWFYHFDDENFWNRFGVSIESRVDDSMKFFKENHLQGPIFNDFDISSFLIYSLYPDQRVFVDQRPEAYPPEFFKEVYIPALDKNDKWKETFEKYGFQTIVVSNTKMSLGFVLERKKDQNWQLAYEDKYVVIFRRR